MQRCLWAWMGPPCSGLPSAVSLLLSLSLPFPVPGNNTLWWLMKLEELVGCVEIHQRWATREPSKPASPGRVVVHPGPAVWGADFSLGSWWVLFLARPDSNFVFNTKSFPSCCSRAFSFLPFLPSCPLHTHPHPLPHAWDPAEVPSPLVQRREPNLSAETEAFSGHLWALPAFSGGLGGRHLHGAPIRAAFRPWVLARALHGRHVTAVPHASPTQFAQVMQATGDPRQEAKLVQQTPRLQRERTVVMRDSRQLVIQEQQQSTPEAAPCARPG